MKITDFGRNHHFYKFMNVMCREPAFDKRFLSDEID